MVWFALLEEGGPDDGRLGGFSAFALGGCGVVVEREWRGEASLDDVPVCVDLVAALVGDLVGSSADIGLNE